MDAFGLPIPRNPSQQIFGPGSVTGADLWQKWIKPAGKTMAHILVIGSGGGGGTGAIGAASTAAGGGGGGSGGITIVEMPLYLLPDVLYVNVPTGTTSGLNPTYVSTQPTTSLNAHIVARANGGGAGGDASGATAGAAGAAGSIAAASSMPLGWPFAKLALAGQAGVIGGTTVAGAALTQPATGLRVTGGTGGGGLPAAATPGWAGGAITAQPSPSQFTGVAGGSGGSGATTPPTGGGSGFSIQGPGLFFYGGTGGGSTHGSATGAGLVQAAGGDGGIGSGGGGMGGALTGSTAAARSRGGSGLAIITCY